MTFQLCGHLPTITLPDGKMLAPEIAEEFRKPYRLALRALELLRLHHAERAEMADYLQQISHAPDPAVERLLREVLARNPHRNALGHATQGLAQALDFRVHMAEGIRDGDAIGQYRIRVQIGGPEMAAWVESTNPAVLRQEIEYLHRRVLSDYADVPMFPQQAEKDPRVIGKASGDWVSRRELVVPGRPAPAIEGETLDGVPRQLSDFRGNVVLLSFWGGANSVDIILERNRTMAERLKGRPFKMLGVSMSYSRVDAEEAIEKNGVTWPVWYDGDSRRGVISAQYHTRGRPDSFLIDAKGLIRFVNIFGSDLDRAIESLLSELEPEAASPPAQVIVDPGNE
jgi:peroxiredoxin